MRVITCVEFLDGGMWLIGPCELDTTRCRVWYRPTTGAGVKGFYPVPHIHTSSNCFKSDNQTWRRPKLAEVTTVEVDPGVSIVQAMLDIITEETM